jgi:hypothetical protein
MDNEMSKRFRRFLSLFQNLVPLSNSQVGSLVVLLGIWKFYVLFRPGTRFVFTAHTGLRTSSIDGGISKRSDEAWHDDEVTSQKG